MRNSNLPTIDGQSGGSSASLARRLLLFAIGGIVGGLVCAPVQIIEELTFKAIDSAMSLFDFASFYSPLGENFWSFVGDRVGAFIAAPIGGLLFGAMIGSMARLRASRSQVLGISICVGFIFASFPLIMLLFPGAKIEFLFVVPLFFFMGRFSGELLLYVHAS